MLNPHEIEDIYDLTPIQQGLLYELTRSPGTGVYVEQVIINLEGPLHPDHFARAWQDIVDCHPILRTSFHQRGDGRPLQVVHRSATLDFERLDWHREAAGPGGSSSTGGEGLDAWLVADRLDAFDLTRPPLMRATLIRTGPESWTFAWRFSHLVMDGWSFGLAIMDMLGRYRAYLHGEPALQGGPAQGLAVRPYRDYSAWWRSHPPASESIEYWREALAGIEPGSPLGHGGITVPAGEPTHDFVHVTLDALGDRIREMARDRALTPATVIHGAWNLLIARYKGTDDVVTGATMAHRPASLPGAETILGPLIATVPARTTIRPEQSAASWLQDFQDRQATGREHVDLPLAEMPSACDWDIAGMETNVAYENVPLPDTDLSSMSLRLAGYTYDGRPHFVLTLVILPGEDTPLRVIYDRRRFGEPAVRLLAGHFRTMLAAIAEDPDLPVGQLPMSDSAEAGRLRAYAEAPLPDPVSDTVIDRLAARAAERPDAVAVSFGDDRLTYAELDERSARLAARLRGAGAGPGRVVALCVSRSADMITAIAAIGRAGAASLPLDPDTPAQRLEYIVDDAAPALVLTERALLSRLPGAARSLPAVVADEPAGEPADAPEAPGAPPDPQDVMYVLYTSGSTGRPKGVPIRHGDVTQFLTAFLSRMDVSGDDTWSMFHTYGFDVSVLEIWGALTTGARLHVLSTEEIRSALRMHQAVTGQGVTVLNTTPSAFEPLAAVAVTAPAESMPLRYVLFCGERLDPGRLRAWFSHHGPDGPRLVNTLGITETTVASTWHEVTGDDIRDSAASPIGLPVDHQRFLVLDAVGQQAPLGCAGELYVAGRSLSTGYLNRPELTKERFLPYPWGERDERMYRTGDLARRRHDGILEFIGRADDQVKIRGYRVEPAEVEAVLRTQPGVAGAAVVAGPEPAGGTRLIAYVVAEQPAASADEDAATRHAADGALVAGLADALRRVLPSYMVPALFMPLEELPLNSSGKLDRKRLPEPGRPPGDRPHVPPRTGTERRLAGLLAGVLKTSTISMDDELTGLGVHSLTAMRIAVGISGEFGTEVGLSSLLDGATPASLARIIDTTIHAGGQQ